MDSRRTVEAVLKNVEVVTEEGGWQLVNSTSIEIAEPPQVDSDATSYGYENASEAYEGLIQIDDLIEIEEDLFPEDAVRLLFLFVNDLPTFVLQKCVVKLRQEGEAGSKSSDSFSEWARRNSDDGHWKCLFLEGLAVIGRLDILEILGLDQRGIEKLQSPAYLSSLKVALATVCSQLRRNEVARLVSLIFEEHLPSHERPTFPGGRILKELLELYILYWMQERVITLTNLAVLAWGLDTIDRHDLVLVLAGEQLVAREPPLQPAYHGEHSKLLSLLSYGPQLEPKIYDNKRGICVIFNQELFGCRNNICDLIELPGHGRRDGSSLDAVNLESVFREFGCHARTFPNLSVMHIKERLGWLSQAPDLQDFDYLVLCFLSHGGTDSGHHFIYGSDCRRILLEKLVIDCFGGNCCPALNGKLKIVITQACQGVQLLDPVVCADGPEGSESPTFAKTSSQADFLFCQATTPGFKAYRDPTKGSFYIRSLCEVLRERGHLEEVTLCIKNVHNRMLQSSIFLRSESSRCMMQPQMIDRTTGQFVFQRCEDAPAAST